jgi:hypothetical protein
MFVKGLVRSIWHDYFKDPLDTISTDWRDVYRRLRTYYFECSWNEVYDFIEFLRQASRDYGINSNFELACNRVLEGEVAGYRFVNGRIAQITAAEELDAIQQAALKFDAWGTQRDSCA